MENFKHNMLGPIDIIQEAIHKYECTYVFCAYVPNHHGLLCNVMMLARHISISYEKKESKAQSYRACIFTCECVEGVEHTTARVTMWLPLLVTYAVLLK